MTVTDIVAPRAAGGVHAHSDPALAKARANKRAGRAATTGALRLSAALLSCRARPLGVQP